MNTNSIAKQVQQLAKQELSSKRYAHSLRVIQVMQNLNRRLFLNIDDEILQITGWAHDIAKEWHKEKLLKAIKQYHRENYLLTHEELPLWHALVAMPFIKEKLDFYDHHIDRAIIEHPTAHPDAITLSQLLFIADENELGREHLTQRHYFMLQYASLAELYLFTITNVISHLSANNHKISILTLDAYQVRRKFMQKQVKAFHQNPFKENTYLYCIDETLLIVDPGVKAEQIGSVILSYQPSSVKILYTHGHFDHIIFGHDIETFLKDNNIPFQSYAGEQEQFYFSDAGLKHINDVIVMYGINDFYKCKTLPKIDHFLKDGESIGSSDFLFYHTPGHTKGSGLFHSASENILFTGDTIFANGSIGRTDFPDSSPEDMTKSLSRIFTLFSPETTIYPGHAMPSTIAKEHKIHQNLY